MNDHDLPHEIGFRVTDVGTRPGEESDSVEGDPAVPSFHRSLTATDVVRPDETRTYPGVFTEPIWYAVEFTMDGQQPHDDGATVYHPMPPGRDRGRILGGQVLTGGEFTWVISGTDDPGPFTPGGTG